MMFSPVYYPFRESIVNNGRTVVDIPLMDNNKHCEINCRMGLLPEELLDKIEAVGNAAGSGAQMLACDDRLLPLAEALTNRIEFLELASLPEFSRTFAKSISFDAAAPPAPPKKTPPPGKMCGICAPPINAEPTIKTGPALSLRHSGRMSSPDAGL